MEKLLLIVSTVVITWVVLHEFIYCPKAQIKRFWKIVHQYELVDGSRGNDGTIQMALSPLRKHKDKIGNLINALLDVYWNEDTEENREFVAKNKYS